MTDPIAAKRTIKPIRIIVDNGHLALYGSVDSVMDKTVAGIRANQIFGAFTVQNNLVVENDARRSKS